MAVVDWHSEVARGALSYSILLILQSGARHGYEIRSLLRGPGGYTRLQGGTLYPLLRRMEEQGLLSHHWDTSISGPARKMHELTVLGRSELESARRSWQDLNARLDRLDHMNRRSVT